MENIVFSALISRFFALFNPLKKRLVTAVKNQGYCGSCYVFSAAVIIEANICSLGHKSCDRWSGVSEQYMLDCGKEKNEDACLGGFPENMLAFSHESGVLDSESLSYRSNLVSKQLTKYQFGEPENHALGAYQCVYEKYNYRGGLRISMMLEAY